MKRYRKLALGGPGPDPNKKKIDIWGALQETKNLSLPKIDLNLNNENPIVTGVNSPVFTAPVNIDGTPATQADLVARPKGPSRMDNILKNAGKFAKGASPFISNIANAFAKAPQPAQPKLLRYSNLRRINLNSERSAVNRSEATANRAAERNVDANTAEAIKQMNRGRSFNELNTINEREVNTNIGIGNQEAEMDLRIGAANAAKQDSYNDSKVAREIAQRTQRSANIANAGDKLTLIGNEKEKAKVDLEKTKTLATVYKKSGVLTRARIEMKNSGITDPLGLNYADVAEEEERMKKLDKKAFGGLLSGGPDEGTPIGRMSKKMPVRGGVIEGRPRDQYGYPIPTTRQFASDPEFYGTAPSRQILSKYSSMTGNGTGQPVPNSPYGKLLNNLSYMKNNWWNTSNVYRPENMHIAANYNHIKERANQTIARFGGTLRKIS